MIKKLRDIELSQLGRSSEDALYTPVSSIICFKIFPFLMQMQAAYLQVGRSLNK